LLGLRSPFYFSPPPFLAFPTGNYPRRFDHLQHEVSWGLFVPTMICSFCFGGSFPNVFFLLFFFFFFFTGYSGDFLRQQGPPFWAPSVPLAFLCLPNCTHLCFQAPFRLLRCAIRKPPPKMGSAPELSLFLPLLLYILTLIRCPLVFFSSFLKPYKGTSLFFHPEA